MSLSTEAKKPSAAMLAKRKRTHSPHPGAKVAEEDKEHKEWTLRDDVYVRPKAKNEKPKSKNKRHYQEYEVVPSKVFLAAHLRFSRCMC